MEIQHTLSVAATTPILPNHMTDLLIFLVFVHAFLFLLTIPQINASSSLLMIHIAAI
jgi:hypothetical protein